MRLALLIGLLVLSGCGAQIKTLKMGKTTRAEVIALKGMPSREEVIPVKDSKSMSYEDGDRFQLKNDIVTHLFRNPENDEKYIIFWKHKFKNCQTFLKEIEKDPHAHTQPELEFGCAEKGSSVIYSKGSEFVSRVVEFEIQ